MQVLEKYFRVRYIPSFSCHQSIYLTFRLVKQIPEHFLGMSMAGMDQTAIDAVFLDQGADPQGLRWKAAGEFWAGRAGLWLLWIAAALTLITGIDYFRKAIPYLREVR